MITKYKKILPSESAIKYFIVQADYYSLKNLYNNKDTTNKFSLIIYSALLTKIGTAPFYFWFPEVMEGLDSMNCLDNFNTINSGYELIF